MELPTLADRVWYALHCLPRDEAGKPPEYQTLELKHGLHKGTLSHAVAGRRAQFQPDTFGAIAKALRVTEAWLRGEDGARGPTLSGMLPPRPGVRWVRHGDVPGWNEAVVLAKLEPRQQIPAAAFLAGADMPVFRPLDRITPAIAIAAAMYAYETSTKEEQAKYSTLQAATDSAAGQSTKLRAAILRRPAVK